ncbi:MAG: hypothetical protein RSB77_06400 [Bacilli bacterium]
MKNIKNPIKTFEENKKRTPKKTGKPKRRPNIKLTKLSKTKETSL